MLHSQYCERKVLVYWVKGLTLIKTIERITWQTVEKKAIDKVCMEHDTRVKFNKHTSEILSWQNR